MQNKLQELTDRLYQEGLSKGKAEGEQILEEARKEAEQIIAQAQAKADEITAAAQKAAAELKSKVDSDIKMASSQALQATKNDIENLVISKVSDDTVTKALAEPEFLKKIILAVAEKFSAQEASDLEVILPEKLRAELEPFITSELGKTLGKNVEGKFSKKIAGGFTVGPKDGSYFVSLTDETFRALIAEYLRPLTRKILFG